LENAMRKLVIGALTTIAIGIFQSVVVASILPKDTAARIEAIPVQTLTISDQLPVVVLMHGSGGFEANTDLWRRQFESLGISTFALDSFSGRGIVSTVVDQSQLGRLNMILDLYRSFVVLAGHPRIDPNRIAVMGFSRGGQAALYGTLKRFHKLWNPTGIDPAAYIALYPPCNTTYISDTDVDSSCQRIELYE
jgi:dienelactone hydrolase